MAKGRLMLMLSLAMAMEDMADLMAVMEDMADLMVAMEVMADLMEVMEDMDMARGRLRPLLMLSLVTPMEDMADLMAAIEDMAPEAMATEAMAMESKLHMNQTVSSLSKFNFLVVIIESCSTSKFSNKSLNYTSIERR